MRNLQLGEQKMQTDLFLQAWAKMTARLAQERLVAEQPLTPGRDRPASPVPEFDPNEPEPSEGSVAPPSPRTDARWGASSSGPSWDSAWSGTWAGSSWNYWWQPAYYSQTVWQHSDWSNGAELGSFLNRISRINIGSVGSIGS